MAELSSMMNIGREMERKLMSVGIHSAEQLMAEGSCQAYTKLKAAYSQVCLVHLYSLEGAICHTEFHNLSAEKKRELKAFSDALKK